MGSESELTSTPPAKLSLFSLQRVEPPGMLTPPIKTLASVPFQWEEAPGKPRPCCLAGGDNKPAAKGVVKCLELPPCRLLTDQAAKVSACMPSPTTVLDGPYAGGRSFRFRSQASEKERVSFGSSRWGSFKKNSRNNNNNEVGGGFDFLFSDVKGDSDTIGAPSDRAGTKLKITTAKSSFSQSKSLYFLGSMYESLKQVVPFSWNQRRQEKQRKKGFS